MPKPLRFHRTPETSGPQLGFCLESSDGVSAGLAVHVGGDLAGQDVTEEGEGIVKGLVVDVLIEVLDEDVTVTGLARGKILGKFVVFKIL